MENLTHIRDRIRAGKRIRARLHRWAFSQLQSFVEYKALAAGISVVYVDPAYTSQSCCRCGNLGNSRVAYSSSRKTRAVRAQSEQVTQ